MEEYKLNILVCKDNDIHFCIYKRVSENYEPILLTNSKEHIIDFIQKL